MEKSRRARIFPAKTHQLLLDLGWVVQSFKEWLTLINFDWTASIVYLVDRDLSAG